MQATLLYAKSWFGFQILESSENMRLKRAIDEAETEEEKREEAMYTPTGGYLDRTGTAGRRESTSGLRRRVKSSANIKFPRG